MIAETATAFVERMTGKERLSPERQRLLRLAEVGARVVDGAEEAEGSDATIDAVAKAFIGKHWAAWLAEARAVLAALAKEGT